MKKPGLLLLVLTLATATLRAQTDNPIVTEETFGGLPAGVEELGGGFLIDMGLMDVSMPSVENYRLQLPDLQTRDFNRLFRLTNDAVYSRGTYTSFVRTGGLSFWDATDNVQMGTFRLPGGASLHTYGDYDSSGRRVYNPALLPWERNTFRGAFELKSKNGNFGIRVEVRR